jgi:hypothetical protein
LGSQGRRLLNSVPDEVVEIVEEAQRYSAPLGLGTAFSDPTSRDKVIEGISVPDVLLDIYRLVDNLVGRIHVTTNPPAAAASHGPSPSKV